jgi:hypothetical protein
MLATRPGCRDTIALMVTALLGIGSFIVQARVAKNAEAAQRAVEWRQVDPEQARTLAAVGLERVRSQMAEVLMPIYTLLLQTGWRQIYLSHELDFEYHHIAFAAVFGRPFPRWPHIEVVDRSATGATYAAVAGKPYDKYSPIDMQLLEDVTKRQLYIEAHTSCMAPCWRKIARILSTKSSLLESPPVTYLNKMFPAGILLRRVRCNGCPLLLLLSQLPQKTASNSALDGPLS